MTSGEGEEVGIDEMFRNESHVSVETLVSTNLQSRENKNKKIQSITQLQIYPMDCYADFLGASETEDLNAIKFDLPKCSRGKFKIEQQHVNLN